jgi:hypothetical protein
MASTSLSLVSDQLNADILALGKMVTETTVNSAGNARIAADLATIGSRWRNFITPPVPSPYYKLNTQVKELLDLIEQVVAGACSAASRAWSILLSSGTVQETDSIPQGLERAIPIRPAEAMTVSFFVDKLNLDASYIGNVVLPLSAKNIRSNLAEFPEMFRVQSSLDRDLQAWNVDWEAICPLIGNSDVSDQIKDVSGVNYAPLVNYLEFNGPPSAPVFMTGAAAQEAVSMFSRQDCVNTLAIRRPAGAAAITTRQALMRLPTAGQYVISLTVKSRLFSAFIAGAIPADGILGMSAVTFGIQTEAGFNAVPGSPVAAGYLLINGPVWAPDVAFTGTPNERQVQSFNISVSTTAHNMLFVVDYSFLGPGVSRNAFVETIVADASGPGGYQPWINEVVPGSTLDAAVGIVPSYFVTSLFPSTVTQEGLDIVGAHERLRGYTNTLGTNLSAYAAVLGFVLPPKVFYIDHFYFSRGVVPPATLRLLYRAMRQSAYYAIIAALQDSQFVLTLG